jgi:hypothetical protein
MNRKIARHYSPAILQHYRTAIEQDIPEVDYNFSN